MRRTKYGRRYWGRAESIGVDDAGGPWAVVCADHATVCNVDTRAQAATLHTAEFCESCMDGEE